MAELKESFCAMCKNPVYRSLGRSHENMKFGWKTYCSRECECRYKQKRQKLACESCGKLFERNSSAISSHNYCSQSCAAILNNKKRPERNAKKIKCLVCEKLFKRWVTGNKKYCSMKCRIEAKRYESEDLLGIIRNTAQKLKRAPTRRELKNINDACRKIFGSWNKAILAAGFIPNRSHDDRMYKRAHAKALDGHLCDSVSELLIDNWLHQNNILHERNAYYPNTRHRADWEITGEKQKIFAEYFGLANDSPRYDRTIKEKRGLCRQNNIFLIDIYPKDIFPINFLDNNLKNKFGSILFRA